VLGGPATPIAILAGVIAAAAAGWLIAAVPMKGQAVFAAIFAGIAAAAAGRLVDYRLPLAVFFVPIVILAIVSPLTGLYLGVKSGGIVATSYIQALTPLANITPLDWIAGGFLGIPLGAAWTTSMVEKRVAAS
jgi:hypothetical protein